MFGRIKDHDFASLNPELKKDMKLSIIEGIFSTLMGSMIGGAILTGFALSMGADSFIIGIMASLPLLANLVQIMASYIIDKVGDSKKVCLLYVILHRFIWLFIVLSPFLFLRTSFYDLRIWIFVALLSIGSIFASISGLSWNSWMADLIPANLRGRFFAKRNMAAQLVGMVVVVAAGVFIDYWRSLSSDNLTESYGFVFLFALGTIAGFISVYLLKKINKSKKISKKDENFLQKLKLPLKDSNFKKFIIFTSFWGFAVTLVSPFFSVYMINTLHIPFSLITLFGVMAGVTNILGMKIWGGFIDKYGAKLLLYICSIGASLIPALWIFASPENYSIIWIINIISGFFWSGIGLASTNTMMNLSPSENNTVYFAVFSAITGLTGALAPIFGGSLASVFNNLQIFNISGLRLLFLTSSLFRLTTVLLLKRVDITQHVSINEILDKFNNWQKIIPIYTMSRFSIFNINYRGNMNLVISRAMVKIEEEMEKLQSKININK